MKYVFPDITVPSLGYLVIFAAKTTGTATEIHTGFKLSSTNGESIYLSNASSTLIDSLTLPPLDTDISYGHYPDATGALSRLGPTPGATNNTAIVKVSEPVFSTGSGFYDAAFDLTITSPENYTIYYTTDGSTPTTSSNQYTGVINIHDRCSDANVFSEIGDVTAYYTTGPVYRTYDPKTPDNVDKCNVIRAIAVDASGNTSKIVTNSYFVSFASKTGYNGMDVISLSTDSSNFFDYNKGIDVAGKILADWWAAADEETRKSTSAYDIPANYTQSGKDWERPVHMEYFTSDKTFSFKQDAGMRIHGNVSRCNAQKSLNIYARSEYGSSEFAESVFGDNTGKNSFSLRMGGNDVNATKLRDVLGYELVKDRDVEGSDYAPCQVFFDGEYWGLYNIQQKQGDDFIHEKYGINKDNVIMMKKGTAMEIEAGEDTDISYYNDYVAAGALDMSADANYEAFCNIVDIQSFIDYFCTEIYLGNSDWPLNNFAMWRSRTAGGNTKEDTKWRWMIYDMDQSMKYNDSSASTIDTIASATSGYTIFKNLLKNANFKKQFVNTFLDMANTNFESTKVTARMNELEALYTDPMLKNAHRFSNRNWTANDYDTQCSKVINFANERKQNMITGYTDTSGNPVTSFLKSDLTLSGSPVTLTASVDNSAYGNIAVNSVMPTMTNNSWSGTYYTDIPITIKATPAPGYVFSCWELPSGTCEDAETQITLIGDTKVKAVFIKQDLAIASFSYAAGTAGTEIANGTAANGYTATGGINQTSSYISASVNGTDKASITTSADVYGAANQPSISAATGNTWATNAYFEVRTSTKGFTDLKFSAKLGGTKKGPRDYKLMYSTDGTAFTDIANSFYSIAENKTMFAGYSDFALPAEAANCDNLYIRVYTASGYTIAGNNTLAGTASGAAAVNDILLSGTHAEDTATQYTVTFDSTGGTEVLPQTVNAYSHAVKPESPTRTDYIFYGWYTDHDCTSPWSFAADTVSGNITLYARWIDVNTAVSSDIFAIDNKADTIVCTCAYAYSDFISHITFPAGATYRVTTAGGTDVSEGKVTNRMIMYVTAAGGESTRTYTIYIDDISHGKTVTATSEQSSESNFASCGNDRNSATRWAASGSTYPQDYTVDLGAVYEIDNIAIDWFISGDRKYHYDLYASDDGTNFTLIHDGTANTLTSSSDSFASTYAKYIKVRATGSSTSYQGYASFFELTVRGWNLTSTSYNIAQDGDTIFVESKTDSIDKTTFVGSLTVNGNALLDTSALADSITDGSTVTLTDYTGDTRTLTIKLIKDYTAAAAEAAYTSSAVETNIASTHAADTTCEVIVAAYKSGVLYKLYHRTVTLKHGKNKLSLPLDTTDCDSVKVFSFDTMQDMTPKFKVITAEQS